MAEERMMFSPELPVGSFSGLISGELIELMQKDGPEAFLAKERFNLKKDTPSHYSQLRAIRTLFEDGYGKESEVGEAFEDGALLARIVAKRYYPKLIPHVHEKIDTIVEAFQEDMSRPYDVPFSDQRLDLIHAIRREGGLGMVGYGHYFAPTISRVDEEKYDSSAALSAITDGFGFVLAQLKWVYDDDFIQFEREFNKAEEDYPRPSDLQNKLAKDVMAIIERSQPGNDAR